MPCAGQKGKNMEFVFIIMIPLHADWLIAKELNKIQKTYEYSISIVNQTLV